MNEEPLRNDPPCFTFSIKISSLADGLVTSLMNNADFTEKFENFCSHKINESFRKTEQDMEKRFLKIANCKKNNLETITESLMSPPMIDDIVSPASSNLHFLHQNILQKKKDSTLQDFVYKQIDQPPHTPRNPY